MCVRQVSTASHTFCGCQTMRGDGATFRLTEHGRANIETPPDPAGVPWYLHLTRREINSQIRATCRSEAHTTHTRRLTLHTPRGHPSMCHPAIQHQLTAPAYVLCVQVPSDLGANKMPNG